MKLIKAILLVIILSLFIIFIRLFLINTINEVREDFDKADELIVALVDVKNKATFKKIKICRIIKDKRLKRRIINVLFDRKLKRRYMDIYFPDVFTYRTFRIGCIISINRRKGRVSKVYLIGDLFILRTTEIYKYERSETDIIREIYNMLKNEKREKKEERLFDMVIDKLYSGKYSDVEEAYKILSEHE